MWFCWALTRQHSAPFQYHWTRPLFVVKSCERNSWGDFSPPGSQLSLCCPGWGPVGNIPHPNQGHSFPPAHGHMCGIWDLNFQRDLNWFLVEWFCWELQQSRTLELRVLHRHSLAGSRAWRAWQGVTCHPGAAHRVQLLFVTAQEIQLW